MFHLFGFVTKKIFVLHDTFCDMPHIRPLLLKKTETPSNGIDNLQTE